MNKIIEKIFRYFSFFSYAPTFEEIYTFYPKKTSQKNLRELLLNLKQKKRLISLKIPLFSNDGKLVNHYFLYTVGEYGIRNVKTQIKNVKTRYLISQNKLSSLRFRLYTRFLSFFPQIKLVGLSGSMAMMNAKEEDDIDLFIITAKNRLFTGRFIAILLAKLLLIHRGYQDTSEVRKSKGINIRRLKNSFHYKDKVCLNLFFDESNLEVKDFKKTEFVGHEILQMKPIIDKDETYARFLKANQWVFRLFPNAISKIKNKGLTISIKNQNKLPDFSKRILYLMGNQIESLLKKIQFFLINRHRTKEIITSTQLWFHPDDFEKKVKI